MTIRAGFRNPRSALASLFTIAALALSACSSKTSENDADAAQAPQAQHAEQPAFALIKVPAGEATSPELLGLVRGWKHAGEVSEVLWLNSNQEEKPGFATIVTLEFPDEERYAQWESETASMLAAPIVLTRADRLTHGETEPRDSSKAVFKANYYQPKVPPERFGEFADGYIGKFMEVQRQANLLTSYSMFLERGGSGQALLILEHLDKPTFDTVTPAKEKLRAALMERDAGYARYEETAAEYREAVSGTTADLVTVD